MPSARLALVAALAACASAQPRVATPPSVAPAAACVGTVPAPPEGATPVDDPALLARAVGAPGEGKLCAGAAFVATRPITVYRVWQRDRSYTEHGRWWSLERPEGPRDAYRARNVICAEWSALDVASRCVLRAGERFVLGPGQSARCEGGSTLAASAVTQVYIDNDTRAGRVLVEGCETLGPWPAEGAAP